MLKSHFNHFNGKNPVLTLSTLGLSFKLLIFCQNILTKSLLINAAAAIGHEKFGHFTLTYMHHY